MFALLCDPSGLVEGSLQLRGTVLRPFDGSFDDAHDILLVDRATFAECPYSVAQIVALLADGSQHIWLAEADGEPAGFVSAFATHTLRGLGWEVDLLAVRPEYRRRGIARALVRMAVAGAAGSDAERSRAVVAAENHASRRAFEAAGFCPRPEQVHLMRCHSLRQTGRRSVPGETVVRRLTGEAEAHDLLRLAPETACDPKRVVELLKTGGSTFFLAGREDASVALMELVHVRTLLYAGAWIETMVAPGPGEAAALIAAAVEWGRDQGWDEIGCLAPLADRQLRRVLAGQGFRSEGLYRVMERTLSFTFHGRVI